MPVRNTRRDVLIGLCCAPLTPLVARAQGNTTPEAGTDYVVLQSPQPVETGDKIEVLEFFQYSCPHCFAFTPDLTAWPKHLAHDGTPTLGCDGKFLTSPSMVRGHTRAGCLQVMDYLIDRSRRERKKK